METARVPTLVNVTTFKLSQHIRVVAGYEHIHVEDLGDLYSAGSGRYGELGIGQLVENSPLARVARVVATSNSYTLVAAGIHISIALSDTDSLFAWGDARFGVMGPNINTYVSIPTRLNLTQSVLKGKTIKTISASSHVLVLTSEGNVYGWVSNSYTNNNYRETMTTVN